MNTDLLLSLLEEIAELKAEIRRLQKVAIEAANPVNDESFAKDRVSAFEELLEEFRDHIF
ncbi:hypothetical protein [Polluticaenibacter yanchengensis]|uniref:Uncharacterized protein n=1 Tax=Polluticaenibacter yanchengensis TaxID=3014562 RepID=A0ABT4UF55_9BACT|nr:hypothetical protein [Chitinophagaceae bacterium LY-5]